LNAGVEAKVTELAGNRVRLAVEVAPADLAHAFEHATNDLAERTKVPGFRKGKVPMPVLIKRIGSEHIYTEAVETHIGGWLRRAADGKRLRPVSEPQFSFELPTSTDSGWSFSAEFDVQPLPKLADWRKLEVGKAEAEIPEGLVEHELEVLRSSVAELAPVEGRPVKEGDTLVVDLVSAKGEESRDYVIELDSGRLVGDVERGLIGAEAGESRELPFQLADGKETSVKVTVKEIKEKVLPPLDDELARAATEFETLEELRTDTESRLLAQIEAEQEAAFREAVVDELVGASQVDVDALLVEGRARELLAALARSLERRGMNLDLYLELTGQDASHLGENLRAEARQSVARELVLEAAANKLKIEVPDSEVEAFVREQAGPSAEDIDELVAAIWRQGRHEELREDLRMSAALDRLAGEVKPIPLAQAEARKQIWTPGQEKPAPTTKLWTPGSEETE
jgi:trigger factor